MSTKIKTVSDLAEMIRDKETELAPGSETTVLGAFVEEFDYVSSVLDGDTDLDVTADATDAYHVYSDAYRRLEAGEEDLW